MKMGPRSALFIVYRNQLIVARLSGGVRRSAIPLEPFTCPRLNVSRDNGGPGAACQRQQEMYIVQREQAEAEYLVRDEQMAYVRAGEAGTRRAVTIFVHRPRIVAVPGVLDVHPADGCEHGAVASHSRGRDTIEEVDATRDGFDDVLRETDAHQVAGPVRRERRFRNVEHLVHR